MGKSILVTGCAGFIGSHLVECLLDQGHQVFGVDNFDPFYPRATKERNLSKALGHPNFSFLEQDIRDRDSVLAFAFKPEIVVHLAAKTGVRPSLVDQIGYLQTNVQGTLNILDWMKDNGLRKMVFASSSSVYGNNQKVPFHEDDTPDSPISVYAFTKRACELQNYTYHKLYDLGIINLRFFTVFGERQRPDLAIHKFTDRILQGKPIQMYGDGSSSRDYTYIGDIVGGICKSIDRLIAHDQPLFETYNLGNSNPMSLADLIATIEKVAETKAIIEHEPMQPGDVERTFADIEKATRVLNYAPTTGIEEGIKRFLAWKKRELAS